MKRRVIGVDPAPGGKSAVAELSGPNNHVTIKVHKPRELVEFIHQDVEKSSDVLLCWDAPLTGPGDPEATELGTMKAKQFTSRPVESLLRKHAPKGISVQNYSGCQHWTITRHLLGLPRVGKFDRPIQELPFMPLHNPKLLAEEKPRRAVVEVHPALALWLWLEKDPSNTERDDWHYKGSKPNAGAVKSNRSAFATALLEVLNDIRVPPPQSRQWIEGDDNALDAYIAFALGYLVLHVPTQVLFLGNAKSGSFLVPNTERSISLQSELMAGTA